MVLKTFGATEVVREKLVENPQVEIAFIYGSYAAGTSTA